MKLLGASLFLVGIIGIIVMLLLIPWFLRKYPPDPRKEGDSVNYIRELVAYKQKYNNRPVNAVFYGVLGTMAASIVIRIIDLFFN